MMYEVYFQNYSESVSRIGKILFQVLVKLTIKLCKLVKEHIRLQSFGIKDS